MLSDALAKADQLKTMLEREVGEAQTERALLKQMDAPAILKRVGAREAFNAAAGRLENELADHLSCAAHAWGSDRLTWEIAERHEPERGAQLKQTLGEIGSLAAALHELDQLHRTIAQRTLVFLRAFTRLMNPRAAAYDRRGGRTPQPEHNRGAWGHG